jgi:hypothetical protein
MECYLLHVSVHVQLLQKYSAFTRLGDKTQNVTDNTMLCPRKLQQLRNGRQILSLIQTNWSTVSSVNESLIHIFMFNDRTNVFFYAC